MKLTNQQLLNYVARIKLTADKKRTYTSQIENLKNELARKIDEHTDMKVKRVIRAGSWKKGTALRPRSEHPLDIDLVFFLDVDKASATDVAFLQATMLKFLLAAYPNKSEDDFKASDKTVNLVFRGSGLEADLVPVVPIEAIPGYVWQPSRSGGDPFTTSVEGQLGFCVDLKKEDSNYTSVVRMLKKWRSRHELELSSFAIELICAWLNIYEGRIVSIEDTLIRFFDFLISDQMPDYLLFPDARGDAAAASVLPYLGDPTNSENNVLLRMTEDEWQELDEAAEQASDALNYAQQIGPQGRTIDEWKSVFGRSFNIEPEDE